MSDAHPHRCSSCGRPLAAGAQECSVCTTLAGTAPASEPAPPRLVAGRYLPQRLLGRGGAKEVWLAHDLTLDRPVALSRLRAAGVDEAARERVRTEARLMARLGDHPRVVTVYDAIDDEGALLIVARFMAGGSLAERAAAAAGGRLPVAEVLRAGEELADALEHAHAHGVVHRDVKPDNAWLAADGSAALGDFGIAVASDLPGERRGPTGTPYYVAPEQAAGRETGPPADLYALGATLYELVCGRPPFTGTRADEVIAQHLAVPPRPPAEVAPGVPEPLDALLLALLAKPPEDRPGSAGAVRRALAGMRGGGLPARVAAGAPLIGRERELAATDTALRGARESGLRAVVLAGDAGIGKTRLAAEIEARARATGTPVVWGRGVAEAGAYGLWVSVLRDLLPHGGDLPAAALDDVRRLTGEADAAIEPVSGEEGRRRLFDAVGTLLERIAGPTGLVVVLDDLHWADRSSLELLRHVTRAAAAAKLLLVLTYREREPDTVDELAGVLDDLLRLRGAQRFWLGGLGVEEVRRFLPAESGLRDTAVRDLHERTGGNPFFVGELALSFADERRSSATVPASVREVVLRRLPPLAGASRQALDAAAVLGRPFTVATVARIAGITRAEASAALEPARTAKLLTEIPGAPGRLEFAHAIVRDVVHDALAPSRRGPLHAAVVEVLRSGAQRGAEVPLAEVAHHALVAAREGEDPQAAYELSIEAAQEATAVLAHAEAAGHYADALEAVDELGADAPAPARAAALEALAAETLAAGDVEGARRHYRQLASVARRAGDVEAVARAALGFAEFTRYGEVDQEGVVLLAGALEALPPADSALRVRTAALLGARLDPMQDWARREALVDESVAMAHRLGDDAALTYALWVSILVNWRWERAAERARAAAGILALAGRASDPNALLWAHMSRLVDALEAGDRSGVEAELAACAAVERGCRRGYFRWCVLLLRATWSTFAGRLDEGAALAADADALARSAAEDAEQEHTVQRLALAKLRWRPHEADRVALRAYAARYADLPVWTAMLANLAWDAGRDEEARQALDAAAADGCRRLAQTSDGLAGCALLAEPAAGLRDVATMEQLYALLAPHAERNPVMDHGWVAWGPVARPLGLLAAGLGRADEAAAHLRHAAELARRSGARGWELRALGDRLASGPAGDEADAVLARALELATELQLPWVARSLVTAAGAQQTTP